LDCWICVLMLLACFADVRPYINVARFPSQRLSEPSCNAGRDHRIAPSIDRAGTKQKTKAARSQSLRSCAVNAGSAIQAEQRTNRRLSIELTHCREFVQKLHVPAHSAIDALNLRILRLDQIVFVGSVCSAAVAKTELNCRKLQWLTGEDVSRP
jgi:hypothetical protein